MRLGRGGGVLGFSGLQVKLPCYLLGGQGGYMLPYYTVFYVGKSMFYYYNSTFILSK